LRIDSVFSKRRPAGRHSREISLLCACNASIARVHGIRAGACRNSSEVAADRMNVLFRTIGVSSEVPMGRIQRGIFDLEDIQLPPLPAANDEVKSVAQIFGTRSSLLIGDQAKESNIKA